jgi:PncC family amidohydrolase
MATGARIRFEVAAAMSITGVAGPGGGTPEKPVGTFCVAVDVRGAVRSLRTSSVGDRHEVRQRATQAALSLLRRTLTESAPGSP